MCVFRMFTVITWFVYSPHWAPPPVAVVFRLSALASGSNTMRIQRAEHTLQPGGLVKDRRDMAAARLVCPCLSESGGGTQYVLCHVRLCWLFLQGHREHWCIMLLFSNSLTPLGTQSHVLSLSCTHLFSVQLIGHKFRKVRLIKGEVIPSVYHITVLG